MPTKQANHTKGKMLFSHFVSFRVFSGQIVKTPFTRAHAD